ncbi:hypothetical protein V2J09_009684 [Rumex salicifolius]
MDESSTWHYNPNMKPNLQLPRSADSSFNFLFNYNFEPPFPAAGLEGKHSHSHSRSRSHSEMMMMAAAGAHQLQQQMEMERSGECDGGGDQKKKRLTSEQLESLENSFQEEIKLDPDRKMKLSRDLGLQPRQVAVWFQNRRARWKAKQLERLYNSLKREFDAVMKLRAMLMEQATRIHSLNHKQVSVGCTEISGGDETVESTSPGATAGGGGGAQQSGGTGGVSPVQSIAECHYMFSADDYNNTVASPPAPSYWPTLPPCYPC